ncbi:MAG: hypothetical protein E7423_03810 [Ruminococcaceae bacterium]|jgi:transposase-like protein|nr:hypothetical protein [Oscillospiraceae bacterium]
MRKKVLSIVLALALMLTIAPATVFAAETITVTSDKAEVEVGQEFTLTVKLPDTGTFGGFEAFLNYDGDKVEYVSSAKGGLVKVGADFSDLANQPANNRVFALATIVDEGTWDFAQDFFTVTFKVKDGATGSVAPTFEISTYFDYDFNDIEYTVDMAAVTVKAGETPHTHTLVKTDEVPATCTAEGTKAYWTCSDCGKMFSDEAGTAEITAPEKIAKLDHTWGEWTETKPATETEEGEEERTCSVCGEKETRTIAKLDHVHTLVKTDEVPATCAAEGTKAYWTCSDCGKMFSDEAGTTEITAPEKIAKLDHTWGEWTETKPATETEEGEEERTCSVCGEKETRTIPKLDHVHTLVKTDEVPATCAAEGTKAYWTCSACGKMFSDEEGTTEITAPEKIAKLDHTWGEWTETKPATETEEGEEERVCSVCGEKETRTIPKLDHVHTLVKTDEVPATCTAEGTKAYWTCSACGKMFSDEEGKNEITAPEKIAALGHTWGPWTTVKEATKDEDGEEERVCSVCGEKETRTVKYEDPAIYDGGESTFYEVDVLDANGGNVKANRKTASRWGKVTVTMTPDEGYEVDELVVTDRKGNEVKVTDQGDGKFVFTMPASNVTVDGSFKKTVAPVVDEENPFTDVDPDDYFYDAVIWAAENGVTSGTSEDTFSPSVPCNRAQFVTFLWRAAGKPTATVMNPFDDVAEGQYYTEAVLWAVENGVTNGTGEGTFSPDATLTRGQVVTFLYRYCNGVNNASANPFEDVAADDWFYDAVLWAVEEGITKGVSETSFAPNALCDRGQTVTFLSRVFAD